MSANMRIDQAGLSAGTPGTARDDGLSTGALVTVTSLSHLGSFDVSLLWVGIHGVVDTTSRATLVKSGPSSYSFSPTAGALGSWRIELTADRGTPNEDRQVRIFAIKGGAGKLRIPAANEQADPEANLINSGATYVARSEFNAGDGVTDSPQEDATYVSHWRPVADLIHAQNLAPAPGPASAPADARYMMAGYYDTAALPNAFGIVEGYCTQYVPNEGADPNTARIDARAPGASAHIRWTGAGDVPAGTLSLYSNSGGTGTIAGSRKIHQYSALAISVYVAKTFVGLEIPVLPDDGGQTTLSITIINFGGFNVVLTHAGAQPDAAVTAPFKNTGSASVTIAPFKHVVVTWDALAALWVCTT